MTSCVTRGPKQRWRRLLEHLLAGELEEGGLHTVSGEVAVVEALEADPTTVDFSKSQHQHQHQHQHQAAASRSFGCHRDFTVSRHPFKQYRVGSGVGYQVGMRWGSLLHARIRNWEREV
ncbi:hypothetical protein B296_00000391 [Ensete ventricosum]|uniref:Uncharacterized protein n=1 Tax=Ensete ventricosum TaxID=4639 RepID=A0A427B934_ENSVE|nr:hypothetical protein B296_00000391 [Ensete ventricosum]